MKCAGYLAREREAARKLAELADFRLPAGLDYGGILSMSTEARQKLDGAAGITRSGWQNSRCFPSELQNLVLEVLKQRRAAQT